MKSPILKLNRATRTLPHSVETAGNALTNLASQQKPRLKAVQLLKLKKNLELKSDWDGDVCRISQKYFREKLAFQSPALPFKKSVKDLYFC